MTHTHSFRCTVEVCGEGRWYCAGALCHVVPVAGYPCAGHAFPKARALIDATLKRKGY